MIAPQDRQEISLDLDGLVARYGRKLAQAELEAEVATQRADRAEQALHQLAERVAQLEADADVDDVLGELEELETPPTQEAHSEDPHDPE